jgi:hypothetical protein
MGNAVLAACKEGDYVRFVRTTDDHLKNVGFILGVAFKDDTTVYLRYAGKPEVNHRADMRSGAMRHFVGDSWSLIEGYFEPYDDGSY